MRALMRCALAIVLPVLLLVIPAIAASQNEVTVCPVGCDYAAIQPAIDAAIPGDTIVVAAGVYTGQLILRSNLTLTAQAGPADTIITALASPIISGSDVSSVTLQGFGLQGSTALTVPIGIALIDSSVVISNAVISNLHGIDGTPVYTDGSSAIGLQISGTFSVTVFNSIIENIAGGNADSGSVGQGGDGIGIAANGDGQLTVVTSTMRGITGGGGGNGAVEYSACQGVYGMGGRSLGIAKEGSAAVLIQLSTITGLTGGPPCHDFMGFSNNAGDTTAIQVISGTLDVYDSAIANISAWADCYRNVKLIGIASSNNAHVDVENTEISTLLVIGAGIDYSHITMPAPTPICFTSGSAVGLISEADSNAALEHNVLQNLQGAGFDGQATGLYAHDTEYITAARNQIGDLTGGSTSYPQDKIETATYGMVIENGTQVVLDGNHISHLSGGQGVYVGYGWKSSGGGVVGLQVISTTESDITNNLLDSLVGGNGTDDPSNPEGAYGGGNAIGLSINGGASRVQNNTVYFMQGGERGYPTDIAGQGIGLKLDGSLSAFVTNNALISNTVGVSSTTDAVLWDYNALWNNTLDYSGIVTGPHDVHLNPEFVDPLNGDFHLRFSSPLIDAGFDIGAPDHDLDNNPRPLDGNGDGQVRTDIAAFEFQPITISRVYLPVVFAAPR